MDRTAVRRPSADALEQGLDVGSFGPLLGAPSEPAWEVTSIDLEPGDQLVLYTDGVTDARGPRGASGNPGCAPA